MAQSVFNLAKQELQLEPPGLSKCSACPRASPLTLESAMGLVYPDDLDMLIRAREQLRRSPGAIELDYRVIRPDGEPGGDPSLLFSEVDARADRCCLSS